LRQDIGLAISTGQYGAAYQTREDIINALVPAYPELTKDEIAAAVYDLIPDIPQDQVSSAIESIPQVGVTVATSLVESEKRAFEPVASFFKRLFTKEITF